MPSSALKSYTSFFFFFFCFSFLKFFLFFILFNLLLLLFVNQILHIFKGWVGSVTSFSETLPGEFPGDSVVRTTTFSLRRAQVQFLVGKLPTPPKKEKLFLSSLNSLRAGFHALFLQCLAQSLKYSFTETPSFSILINNASCPLSFFFFTSYNFLTHSTCYLYFAYFLGQGFCFVLFTAAPHYLEQCLEHNRCSVDKGRINEINKMCSQHYGVCELHGMSKREAYEQELVSLTSACIS